MISSKNLMLSYQIKKKCIFLEYRDHIALCKVLPSYYLRLSVTHGYVLLYVHLVRLLLGLQAKPSLIVRYKLDLRRDNLQVYSRVEHCREVGLPAKDSN